MDRKWGVMHMVFQGKVHSVGNGFCYEGLMDCYRPQYHFVIDCGSLNKQLMRRAVDDIKRKGDIDLFILTHLHRDHYNGLITLLRSNIIPKTIIMPYLYPEERLCLLLRSDLDRTEGNLQNELDSEDRDFLQNPYSYVWNLIKDHNVKLILVRGSSISEPDNSISEESNWGITHPDEDSIKKSERLVGTSVKIVKSVGGGTKIGKDLWYFKLYNNEIDLDSLNHLRESLKRISLQNLSKEGLGRLYKEYSNIASKLGKDINNTSIVVYHAPVQSGNARLTKSWCGTLITGDINLKYKNTINDLVEFYKAEKGKVELFSMPHHGSKHNWNNTILDMGLGDNTVCFSSSISRYRNRMTPQMYNDLASHGISVYKVTEDNNTELIQCVHPIEDGYIHCVGNCAMFCYGDKLCKKFKLKKFKTKELY